MKRAVLALLLAAPASANAMAGAAGAAHGAAQGALATPVQKVLELLNGMLEKGKAEKQKEEVQFAAYKTFCDNTAVEKQGLIKRADEKINVLKADIEKSAADASRLAAEIAAHDEDISVWTGDTEAATKVRQVEKADYDATHTDYSESVDALTRAIAVLKKQAHNRKQASLAQLSSLKELSLIPDEAKRAIESFIAQDPSVGLGVTAPQAHGYEFQSKGIIEMLEELQDKFVAERTTLEKEEFQSKSAYELLVQDLRNQIREATQDRENKAAAKAKKLQAKADAEGSLTDTSTTRADDAQYLQDLVTTCEQKASDFSSRQGLRAEELQAIQKAVEIISGASVAGSADKHLPALLQAKSKAKGSALVSLRADLNDKLRARLMQYLRDQARELNSRVLSMLATHVESDPFKKVKKMIQDLVIRLQQEANEEAEHKGWCDTELATNENTRNQKTQAVETLHAEIDQLNASITKLTEDLASLAKAVADLDAAVAEATQLRQAEKAKNTDTVKDAQEAQTAVANALAVLREFYAKAAQATSFSQTAKRQQPQAPEIFDGAYTGMGAENGGVTGMLEVIQSDFARLEAETSGSEAAAQKQYEQFIQDSRVDKAQKSKDIEHKSAKKQDQSQALAEKTADLEGTQRELTAALAYFDKLKPSCIDAGVTFEDRTARRKEEIESLQEALRILNGE